ncbi:MAG TPA: cobalamin-binding protein [Blastocatellia bacterium]|jgi:iron complex transport system substrate-binding protein|nr:cobalamin-binding protein [Blastocatellia bacterium]
MTQHRIVSLIASATEIVCALGFEKDLVGRSHECDYPPSVKLLPVCTSPKFNVEGTSYEIDQRVKSILQDALSVYRVDATLLDALQPTHIITQSQCEVCAVSLKDVEQAVCELTGSNPAIVSLEPNALLDVWADIKRVGKALDASDRAEELVSRLEGGMSEIARTAGSIGIHPTVACIEWIDPLMAGGNWMPELIEMAGGINLFGEAGKHSPWMTWEELESSDPDVIIVTPCGFDIDRSMEEMHLLASKPGWLNLKAVRAGRVIVADGNQYFNRPGPRLFESLEILAEVFHPDTFDSRHEDRGWVRYSATKPARAR